MTDHSTMRTELIALAVFFLFATACSKQSDDTKNTAINKGAPAAGTRQYTLRFDRPLRVGQRYRLSIHGSMEARTTADGKVLPQQTFKSHFEYEALVTVKAVTGRGTPTKEEHKIDRFSYTKDGKNSDLVARGAVVTAEVKQGATRFLVNGNPPSPEVAADLASVIDLDEGGDVTTDDVYGPGGPKKPGDTWKANAVKLVEEYRRTLKKKAIMPKARDIKSRIRFVGPKKLKGMDVLYVTSAVTIDNLIPNLPNVKGKAGSMTTERQCWIPVDTSSIAYEMTENNVLRLAGEVPKGGKAISLRLRTKNTTKRKRIPVK